MLYQLPGLFSVVLIFGTCPGFCQGGDLTVPPMEPPVFQQGSEFNLAQEQELPAPLLKNVELEKLLGSDHLIIIDLGPEKELFDEAHIPGAQYVDWVEDITDPEQADRYMVLPKQRMEVLLGRLGFTEKSRIVLYDDLDNRVSLRMYWTLKYYGLDNQIQVLDGGRRLWVAEKRKTTAQSAEVLPTVVKLGDEKSDLAVNLDFIADRLQDPEVTLVDGRPKDQYTGEAPGKVFHTGALHKNRGHIPGAVNILWKDNFNEDGTFKSVQELEKLYEGVTGSDTIVTYCNEGLHAVPPWFVMSELLGVGNVRVYDASLSEWANSDQPVETKTDKDSNDK